MNLPDGYNSEPYYRSYESLSAGLGSVGTNYFVDGNAGDDAQDGRSWDQAFRTLAKALKTSHDDIAATARGWAGRNRIYVKGDPLEEDLVALAQKTDVIGVGSMDWRSRALLVGNHVIPDTGAWMGCRFFNMEFKAKAAGGDIFTLDSQHGVEFVGCTFSAFSATPATGALLAALCVDLKLRGCRFIGAYSDAVIEVGADLADGLVIEDCYIQGGENGIEISGDAVFTAGNYGMIRGNTIATVGTCLIDTEQKSYVIGNHLFTGNAKGTEMEGALACNIALAQDNRCTTNNANNVVYPAQGAI